MVVRSAFSPTIRGRDAELAVLGEHLDRFRSGSGAVLLIEGEAGMGKSRLIGEGARMAQRLSLPFGIGAAEPSESVAELAPLLRALFDGSADPMWPDAPVMNTRMKIPPVLGSATDVMLWTRFRVVRFLDSGDLRR